MRIILRLLGVNLRVLNGKFGYFGCHSKFMFYVLQIGNLAVSDVVRVSLGFTFSTWKIWLFRVS